MKKRFITYMLVLVFLISVLQTPAFAAGDSSVQGWSPYEDETLYDRKPVISWLIASGGSKVIAYEMLLDGKKVEAQFDESMVRLFPYRKNRSSRTAPPCSRCGRFLSPWAQRLSGMKLRKP